MNSALYYPFTGPSRETFLKTALFLWDSVDFIVPYREFHRYNRQNDELAALELIGREYVPTPRDQREAHLELEDVCTSDIADRFVFELEKPDLTYNFYPEKLLYETWEMLQHSKLADIDIRDGVVRNASTGPLFGYYMMTILAVCCARNRKRMITDETDPYRVLANLLADDAASSVRPNDWHGRLISLSLNGPDFSSVPLKTLVDLRSREDQLMLELRRNYLREVDQAAHDISENAHNPNIVSDRIKLYHESMEKDLKELKRVLRRSAASLILSKEFAFSLVTAASAVTVAPVSGILTAGGLYKGLMDYQDRRRNLLKSHPSSWLFSALGPNIPFA